VDLAQLRNGKGDIRLVGEVQFDQSANEFCVGVIVPDAQWKDSAEWEAAHRESADKG